MRCLSPRTVGFKADGKAISWSPKEFNKELATFQLPCGKCLECRLDYARQWAIRCIHEAQMHPKNAFVTLTYSDEYLKSPKLVYSDFQKFMKRLRKSSEKKIRFYHCGEYGEESLRPHYHGLLFNYDFEDKKLFKEEQGNRLFTSETLSRLWPKGNHIIGEVSRGSSGYVARVS